MIDFVVSVRAPRTIGIHDALLTDAGRGLVESHVTRIGAEHGVEYRRLAPADDRRRCERRASCWPATRSSTGTMI